MQYSFAGSGQIETDDTSEAVRLAQGGDSDAFNRIYTLHSRQVYRLCLHMAGNPAEAEDLTQEAFLQLFRKIHTFRGESKFSTWLHRLTINVVLMRRRKKRHPEVSFDLPNESGEGDSRPIKELSGPDLRLNGVIDHVNLSRAIEQLPDGYKEMFILHDVEGYENREIAEILGCSVGNCKSQLFKARLHLRQLLQEELRSRAREQRQSTRNVPVHEHRHNRFQCAKA